MSPDELSSRLKKKAILFLPLGSLEWHNEHLPIGLDTQHAIELSIRLAKGIGGVVLPAFWWNTGNCHDHKSTYHMPEDLYHSTLKNICLGLVPITAKLLIMINAHGSYFQMDVQAAVSKELNDEGFPMHVFVVDPFDIWINDNKVPFDHADTVETSLALELIPQLVRMERKIKRDIISHKKRFKEGRPSKEIGRKLWELFYPEAKKLIEKEYVIING